MGGLHPAVNRTWEPTSSPPCPFSLRPLRPGIGQALRGQVPCPPIFRWRGRQRPNLVSVAGQISMSTHIGLDMPRSLPALPPSLDD